jgi:hypothetical protein
MAWLASRVAIWIGRPVRARTSSSWASVVMVSCTAPVVTTASKTAPTCPSAAVCCLYDGSLRRARWLRTSVAPGSVVQGDGLPGGWPGPPCASPPSLLAASTASAWRRAIRSQLTSARISVASRCTTSPLAIPAATQAPTVRARIARNRSAPQRWRTRVRLEWSGSASCRP